MEIVVSGTGYIQEAAKEMLTLSQGHKIFLFYGEMGSGKTTLIKALCEELGVKDDVSSPTFSIINEYLAEKGPVYHADLYRLKKETEALDFGIEEYLYSDHYCFIEWPEKIPNLLPAKFMTAKIRVNEDGSRNITLAPNNC